MHQLWEAELAGLLSELSSTQSELLAVLVEKREYLIAADRVGMQSMQPREEELLRRLQGCQERRKRLLEQASRQGLPSDSIRSLATIVPSAEGRVLAEQVEQASARSQLLQHQSLANWVLAQRTLLHLSQLLEIIATGGRARPTYGKGESSAGNGTLVDQAA